MSDEEELRRLAVELKILESTIESFQSRINFVDAALIELKMAKKSLEGIRKANIGSSLFVPIGGGSYIKTKLDEPDQIVYGIGAGVSVEKPLIESEEGINNRILELKKTRKSLEEQLSQFYMKIQEDQTKLEELNSKIRSRESQ